MKVSTPDYDPPTPEEVRAIHDSLKLTLEQGSRLIGITRRTMSRYTSTQSAGMPYPMLFTLIARASRIHIHPDTWRHQVAHQIKLVAA